MKNINKIKLNPHMINVSTYVITIILILGISAVTNIPKYIENKKYCDLTETVMVEHAEVLKEINKLKSENQSLEDESNENITHIYNRILEIQKSSPDEIRGKVIKSVKKNMELDSMTRKASVLALLNNYEELGDDIEVQTYLDKNVDLKLEIDKNFVLIDNLIKVLNECEEKIESINKELDAAGLENVIQ